MSVDVVCTGRVFLDLTFEGLAELPAPGRERWAEELHESPGGAGTTAVGIARLGLAAALAAPLGDDLAGRMLRALLEVEGVDCAAPASGRTAVTVVLPLAGDRAMVTYEPPGAVDWELVERLDPRAVVASADQVELVPPGLPTYVVAGDDLGAAGLPAGIERADAVLLNCPEALRLTRETTPEAAAVALGESVETVVVSCGSDGAVAVSGGQLFTAPAPTVQARDTTGAGDLLVAAWVAGDLQGLPLERRLQRAVVYATLSVQRPTGAMSAATLEELEHALGKLTPSPQPASAKEAS